MYKKSQEGSNTLQVSRPETLYVSCKGKKHTVCFVVVVLLKGNGGQINNSFYNYITRKRKVLNRKFGVSFPVLFIEVLLAFVIVFSSPIDVHVKVKLNFSYHKYCYSL